MSSIRLVPEVPCEECGGETIEFRGSGKNTQHRICTRWREPGHLTEEQIRERLREVRLRVQPSGRFG